MKKWLLLLPFLLLAQPNNFNQAKKELVKLYKTRYTEFYCLAPIRVDGGKIQLLNSDRFEAKTSNSRAKRIEWEHIMPMSVAYQHFPCWREGGRKHCQQVDKKFNQLEADMFNLVPSIGSINGDRSNFSYAEGKNLTYNQYGNCQVYTDFKNKKFYPANYSKGYIARTYLYMSKTYNIRLSNQERKLMEAWNQLYPADEYELKLREDTEKVMKKKFAY